MNQIEKSAREIRENGARLLKEKKIESKLRSMGELYFTGSYALDLMTWNDIDMQIILKNREDPKQFLSAFFVDLIQDPDFIEGQIIHFKNDYKPKMPRGVYLGFKLDVPDLGGLWKLDLWCLEKNDFDKNQKLIEQLKKELTPEMRQLILKLKTELMKKDGRVPQMGSHFLYQAVLIEKLKDPNLIYDFLKKHGIAL